MASPFLWLLGLTTAILTPQPAQGADKIHFNYGMLEFPLSVDSLETFAKTGEIDSELGFYTQRLREKQILQLQRILRRRINIDPILLYRLTRSPMVVEIIQSLGEVATTHHNGNGFYAIRGSVTNAALKQGGGVTLIDVLREFPGENIEVDLGKLIQLQKELTALVEYREAVRELVAKQATQESGLSIKNTFLPQRDLRVSGGIVHKEQIIEIGSRMADKNSGIRSRKPFRARLYLPQGLSEPAPLVVMSHGFGSEPKSFDYLGEHLASYGIAAVSVEHIGSDSDYELEILEGARKQAISPQEFIERPLDVRYVLDEIERRSQSDPQLQKIDLQRVGVIGHSLGGYTALTLAGAEINSKRLRQQCPHKKINLNMSLLLQCRAKKLVPQQQLADPRIKAAMAISPISSGIHGQESLSQISIPTAIFAGSEDIIAPVVQEQVYPFTWLSAKDKYLAMLIPGDHFAGSNLPRRKPAEPTVVEEFVGRRLGGGQPYVKAFAVAFIKAHLAGDSSYFPYLTAAYARDLSDSEVDFNVVRSLDLEAIEAEYQDVLPVILPTLD